MLATLGLQAPAFATSATPISATPISATPASATPASATPATATATANIATATAILDPQIQAIAVQARSAFLATQPFQRLNLAVWVQATPGGLWRGGEVDAETQVYPASMVKLPFGIDSVLTCVERGAAPACQHDDLVPMLVDSDNVATGRLVDELTGTRNLQEPPVTKGLQAALAPLDPIERDAAYAQWLAARRHTEQRLEALGLRGGMRLFTKTYPTNSGEEPLGFEQRARQELGRNSMSARDIAALMRALVDGELDRAAHEAPAGMRRGSAVPVLGTLTPYLTRSRFSLQSALASGAPPGTQVVGKMGSAYDTLEEVAVFSWPEDPQKPRVLIAAFSDGLDPATPEPFDGWRLAGLTTEVLTRLKLMAKPAWHAPQVRRGTIARWQFAPGAASPQLAPGAASRQIEVQYRIGEAAAGLRRVHLRCTPGCSSASSSWTWPAAYVAARPLLLGELTVPAGATVEVEAELEDSAVAPGEVQWIQP